MAISVVQTVSGSGSASPVSATLAATTAGTCLVVVFLNHGTSAPAVTGMTIGGSASNFGALKTVTNSGEQVSVWACPSCPGGQTALSVSGTSFAVGGGSAGIVAYEVTGLAATLAALLDQFSTGTGSSGTWSSGATPTTTQASEFVAGGMAGLVNTPTGPSSPWANTSPATSLIAGQQVASSAGAFTYSGTVSSTTWAAAVVTLNSVSFTAKANPGLNQAVMRSAVF